LRLYQELLALRRQEAALSAGRYRLLRAGSGVLAYERSSDDSLIAVALNLGGSEAIFDLDGRGEILLSTLAGPKRAAVSREVLLSPHEGVVVRRVTSSEG
jgi:alpha-glucosidase